MKTAFNTLIMATGLCLWFSHTVYAQSSSASNTLSGTAPTPIQFLGSSNAYDVLFKTNGTTRMTLLNSNGFLGIGTTVPNAPLVIRAADGNQVRVQSSNGNGGVGTSGIEFGNAQAPGGDNWNQMAFIQQVNYTMTLKTNGNGNIVLSPGGNVGIGATNPGAKLHLAGTMKMDGANTLEFGAGTAGKEGNAGKIGYQTFTFDALDIVGAGTTSMNRKIKFWNEGGAFFAGNVGIGTNSTTASLAVAGNRVVIGGSNISGTFGANDAVLQMQSTSNAFLGLMANISGSNNNNMYFVVHPQVGYGGFALSKTGTNSPLNFAIFNEGVERFRITPSGQVCVGEMYIPTGYMLSVKGKIITEEVDVRLRASWPDYVFKKDYCLPTLKEVEYFIQENGHLPEIPSAKQVEENGLKLGEMQAVMMKKIEELTLYMIEQQKTIDGLKKEVAELKLK